MVFGLTKYVGLEGHCFSLVVLGGKDLVWKPFEVTRWSPGTHVDLQNMWVCTAASFHGDGRFSWESDFPSQNTTVLGFLAAPLAP